MARTPVLHGAVCTLVLLLALVPAARSGTVSVTADQTSATLSYRAAPGERNVLQIARVNDTYEVEDSAGVVARDGCKPNSDDPAGAERVYCTLPPGLPSVASVYLGDRNDEADLSDAAQLAAKVFGGPGSDYLAAPGYAGSGGIPLWAAGAVRVHEPLLRPVASSSVPRSTVSGGPGVDSLFGGAGNDLLAPGAGHDIVQGFRGDDRVIAREGSPDYIECDAGQDRVKVDRFDFVWGRKCGVVRRLGATVATPLGVTNDYDFGYILEIVVGCPSDSPSACEGTLTLAVRRGRPLLQRRFRITPGVPKVFAPYVSDADGAALERHDARVTIHTVDSTDRVRRLSRVFDIPPLPDGE